MPSFDIVSKTDLQEIDNAINSVLREISERYDFKGAKYEILRDKNEIRIAAEDGYKLTQITDSLKVFMIRRGLDAKALELGKEEKAAGNSVRQIVNIKQGIESEIAKKIVKEVKATKIKAQLSIRGDEVRVDGKKRDDLQEVIAFVKGLALDLPLNFINFRD